MQLKKLKDKELIEELLVHKFSLIKKIEAIDNLLNILKQDVRSELGYKCKEARRKIGMSVKELAKKADVGIGVIYDLESNKQVHPKSYTKVFDIFGLKSE